MGKTYTAIYLLFCTLIAFLIWTAAYALILQLLFGDSRILALLTSTDPFAPAKQVWAYSNSRAVQMTAGAALLPALLITGVIAFVGLRAKGKPLGDASFQTNADLRRSKLLAKSGHIFGKAAGKLLRVSDDRHHLIIGPTRSGKGAGYVIPNALMHRGSMIVTDLKGEVYERTAGYRKQNGNIVYLFSPGSERTHRYNPLDLIRDERGVRTTDIQNVASILVPESSDSENSVWQATAQQVIAGVISYVLESNAYKDRRNLAAVNSFFNTDTNVQDLMRAVKGREPNLSRFTVESFNSYLALSDRAAASALLDIQKAMRPFKNERIAAATAVTDMDLRALQRRPITIYLAPNITDLTLLRPLLTLFVQQVMDLLTLVHNPKALPVYFLLDEFRQLKKMTEITTKLPYVAGYNIKLAFIIQDLKNLDEIYGETSRHSLLGNCGYQLILGANDQATAEYASKALGKTTIRYTSESKTIERIGLPRRTQVEQIRERDLMMPQEVRQMSGDRFILLVEGEKPVLGYKLRYFETQPFKGAERVAIETRPEVPFVELLPEGSAPAADVTSNSGTAIAATTNTAEPKAAPAEDEPARVIYRNVALPGQIPEILAQLSIAEAVVDARTTELEKSAPSPFEQLAANMLARNKRDRAERETAKHRKRPNSTAAMAPA